MTNIITANRIYHVAIIYDRNCETVTFVRYRENVAICHTLNLFNPHAEGKYRRVGLKRRDI